MRHIKTGLVAAFAVMFGIVQLICACMPEVQNANLVAPQTRVPHHMSANVSGIDHHAVIDMSEQAAAPHDHGEHDHEIDCSDCDYTVVLAVNVDVTPSVFPTPTFYKSGHYAVASGTRADMAATNLAALRWLDPPRPLSSPTPITLHTRSLT